MQLFRVRPGDDLLIDTDESEDNGAWDIDIEGVAHRRVATTFACRRESSPRPVTGTSAVVACARQGSRFVSQRPSRPELRRQERRSSVPS